ncbi:MAG TPA: patatin-like phospholipase family protein [bacterium]|nr:patatin-like phospholipase family protein [bacterium]
MKVGVALGSGGARGLAHIGVLRALDDLEIPIHCLSGSSMGAVVGAAYASSRSVEKIETLVRSFSWRSLIKLFLPTISREGLVGGDKIIEMLEENLGVTRFSELHLPLALETTDLRTGDLWTLSEGDLITAIRASISIPLVFTPVRMDGKILVDGGLVSPVPVKAARELGADFVIGVNVLPRNRSWLSEANLKKHFDPGESSRSRVLSRLFAQQRSEKTHKERRDADLGFMMILTQTVGISIAKLANFQLQVEQPDLLLEPDTAEINIYDFHRGNEIIDKAYQLTLDIMHDKHDLINHKYKIKHIGDI